MDLMYASTMAKRQRGERLHRPSLVVDSTCVYHRDLQHLFTPPLPSVETLNKRVKGICFNNIGRTINIAAKAPATTPNPRDSALASPLLKWTE